MYTVYIYIYTLLNIDILQANQKKNKHNKLDMKSSTISNSQSRIDNIRNIISKYIIYIYMFGCCARSPFFHPADFGELCVA